LQIFIDRMSEKKFFLPSEWHPQRCVQMTWPHEATDWAPYLDEIVGTMTEIAYAITLHESLVIASQTPQETRKALAEKLSAEQMSRVTIVECRTNDTWARDHGGITLVAKEQRKEFLTEPEKKVLDFRFNGWGNKFESDFDNKITRQLKEQGAIEGELTDCNDFVLEGGSIESDGKGTVFTTSQCLLAPNRNQPMTKEDIEKELKRRLHADRIVWLNHGNLIGDDTDGHIDTIVRICPNDTLLYIKSNDESDEQHADFEALEEELRRLKTAEGKPYNLVALPMTRPCFYDSERLPATYANFLVINGAVIVPTYGQPDLDKQACDIIGSVFKDREIIPIDSQIIIRQHGSIHCLTMQYPF
jgi:agmatine/peptidylarginine deiminase